MDDLIRRSDAETEIKALLKSPYANRGDVFGRGAQDALKIVGCVLTKLPAVDAVEVVHSAWGKDTNTAECLNCKSVFPAFLRCCSFCPFCGAKMDGGDET